MTELYSFGFMLVFICLDIFTGYFYSKISKTYKSSKMRVGLYNKFGSILIVLFFYFISLYIKLVSPDYDIISHFKLTECSSLYIIINEIGSIRENIEKIRTFKRR